MRGGGAYRPDIDGLRGVSVAAVVVFHLWPRALPGGFTGVDVFFVISGFLITSHLREQLDAGRLGFADFYARRVRRLFPALLTVVVATLVLGSGWLLDAEWAALGRHAASGLGYVVNFVLEREGGYFDAPAATKPLHHLWSLAVEEQFYLVWPWLLWLGARAGRRGVTVVMALVVLGSFAANLWLTLEAPAAAFYLPWGRLWELGVGGLLSFFSSSRGATVRGLVGLGLLGFSFVALSELGFPGVLALSPVVGAAALVSQPAGLVGRALSTPPLVWLGKISYPLYLWHWPLLVFARLTSPEPNLGAVLVASVLLSALTWRFVETPVRERRRLGVPALLGASVVLLALSGAIAAGAFAPPERDARAAVFEAAASEEPLPRGVFDSTRDGAWTELRLPGEAPAEVAFVGDSNMLQYAGVLAARAAKGPHRPFVIFTAEGCPPFMELPVGGCRGAWPALQQKLEDPRLDTVVIAAEWSLYFDNPRFELGGRPLTLEPAAFGAFEQWLTQLRRTKRVVLVTSTPASSLLDPRRLVERRWWRRLEFEESPVDRPLIEAPLRPVTEVLRGLAGRLGLELIDPLPTLCTPSHCARVEAGEPLYRDEHHVRYGTLVERFRLFDALVDPR